MSYRDDDRFGPKLGPPKSRGSARSSFAKDVLSKVAQTAPPQRSGALRKGMPGRRSSARLGRGHVAAKFAGASLGSRARRVVIKSRLVVFEGRGRRSTLDAQDYAGREGVGRDGERGNFYSADSDYVDKDAFASRAENDRHQFRFIVSPEDAFQLGDLESYTRQLMAQMERDLGTRLDWVAVNHWDTDNPHAHILLRGKTEDERDLIIARDYISHGMRLRAAEIATEWLGLRTEREIRANLVQEVSQERWTSLDREIQKKTREGVVDLRRDPADAAGRERRALLLARLDRLTAMGLASRTEPGVWTVAPDFESTLRAMGERGDIIRTLQRAFTERREHAIFDPTTRLGVHITGRVAATGLMDELHERGYLIVDGVDGRAHYVPLPSGRDRAEFPKGALVTVRTAAARPADRNIQAMAENGIYRTERHLESAQTHEGDPLALVQAHVRRLEALRRAGIVERLDEGVWRIPPDLVERGRQYDAKRVAGAVVEIQSELSLRQQVRAFGATWLDRELVARREALAPSGFGAEVREALSQREQFLVEHGFAQRRGQRVVLMRDLLSTLRSGELEQAAQAIQAETGLTYRPITDGQPISGTYRRSVALIGGRFAMLDDAVGFSLVPWRPFLEKRLGQPMSAVVRGEFVSWEMGRQRGMGL